MAVVFEKITDQPSLGAISSAHLLARFLADGTAADDITIDALMDFILDDSVLTGTPTAPTPASINDSTQIATTEFVHNLIDNLVASAPSNLNTLDELAGAINDDPAFALTVAAALAGKQASDATLTALSGASTAAFGIGLLALANAAALRSAAQLPQTYPSGRWLKPSSVHQVGTGTAPGVNSMKGYIEYIREPITITDLGFRVTTSDAAGNAQVAIYAAHGTTLAPNGSAMYSSGNISLAGTSGTVSSVATALTPGYYWFFFNTDSASAIFTSSIAGGGGQSNIVGSSSVLAAAMAGVSRAQTFNSWPSLSGNFSSDSISDVTANTVPIIAFKV